MKMKRIGIALLSVLFLTGCASIPEAKRENGIAQAVETVDKEVSQIANNQEWENIDIDKCDFITKEEEGYRCKVSIGESKNRLNIDAPISVTGENGVAIIKIKPLNEELSEEKVREAFFKDVRDVQNVTDMVYDNWEQVRATLVAQADGLEMSEESITLSEENMMLPETPHYLWLKTEDDLNVFLRDVNAASIYFSCYLGQQVKDLDKQVDGKVLFNKDISSDYTVNMAWEEFERTMNEIGITDLQQTNCRTYASGNDEGYYSFAFTKCINGIPLVSDRQRSRLDEIVTVGNVEITKDGIACLQADNILWEEVSSSMSDCIHVGQFIQILNEYVEKDKIIGSADVTFSRLELSYQIITEDWRTATLKPVWRLYIPLDELIEEEIKVPEGVPTDVLIDAVTGELISKTYY